MTNLPERSVSEIPAAAVPARIVRLRPALLRGSLVALAGVGIAGGLSYSSIRAARPTASHPTPRLATPAPVAARAPLPALDFDAVETLRSAMRAASLPPPLRTEQTEQTAQIEAAPAVDAETTPDVVAAEAAVNPFTRQAMVDPTSPDAASNSLALQTVPLPVPRPLELRGQSPLLSTRRAPRRVAAAAVPVPQAPQEDTRSFFDKLFGAPQAQQSPALAYASLEQPPAASAIPRQVAPTRPSAGGGVAVYDISARTVTLPSGERLEAHSGLGEHMDNPSSVAIKMRGATPPGVYDLTEREQLFHGVRAIRLNPVGGAASIYGRAGLLAHTFMLGPSGASNGCISFRDYGKFLQAYLSGQISRVMVVAGSRQDSSPTVASRATVRTAKAGD